ncbi:hypothetical protein ACTQ46_06705 [Gallicola sp. Sow4_E12]|uniref:hypothetical protein n=1 Tax=Gallicola sp. Sow4_E12 TaxID=3438785 RepID=UPI003F91EF6C
MDKCLSKIYSEDFKKDIVLNLEEQRETISRFLGYKNREIPVIIEKKIQEEINTVYSLIDIDFDYIIEDRRAFLIYTVGDKIQDKINQYTKESEAIRGLILDKIAIVILDEINSQLIKVIERQTGLFAVKENYPGSSSYPLSKQKEIYEKMKNIKSIAIGDSFQLYPIKSVALEIELGRKTEKYSRCEECSGCDFKEV